MTRILPIGITNDSNNHGRIYLQYGIDLQLMTEYGWGMALLFIFLISAGYSWQRNAIAAEAALMQMIDLTLAQVRYMLEHEKMTKCAKLSDWSDILMTGTDEPMRMKTPIAWLKKFRTLYTAGGFCWQMMRHANHFVKITIIEARPLSRRCAPNTPPNFCPLKISRKICGAPH